MNVDEALALERSDEVHRVLAARVRELERHADRLGRQIDAHRAELDLLRARDEAAEAVVRAWEQVSPYGLPAALVASLKALARAHGGEA